MVEQVDTQDLKSCGKQRPCGFDSRPGYYPKNKSLKPAAYFFAQLFLIFANTLRTQALKILILHHILWAHYKNAFYHHLYKKAQQSKDFEFKVLQVSASEGTRLTMDLGEIPNYPYQLFSDKNLEDANKWDVFKKIIAEINRYKPQVMNVNGFFTWYHIGTIIYCKLKGIKVVLSNDSTASDNPAVWWKSILKKLAVKLSEAYYCFGQKAEEYLLELGGNTQKTISKRAAVVDNEWIKSEFEFHIGNKETLKKELGITTPYNFIYVGRFIAFKNLPFLIEAFAQIKQNNWGLIFVGDGNEKPHIEKAIEQFGTKNVYFLGSKTWQQIPQYLTLADVLVLPSKSEPWGLVLNEAMVCGLPIIVSDACGSAIDLVDQGQNGFTFENNNVQSLYQCLQYFMENPNELSKMGKLARQKIQNFNLDYAANDFIKGCKSVLVL